MGLSWEKKQPDLATVFVMSVKSSIPIKLKRRHPMKTPELIMSAMEERIEELENVCKLVDRYLESEMPYADLVD
jgi:hypothetical protein